MTKCKEPVWRQSLYVDSFGTLEKALIDRQD